MEKSKREYVTLEQAYGLKELGYDWPTSAYYDECNNVILGVWNIEIPDSKNRNNEEYCVSIPTQSEVCRWLRDTKDYHIIMCYGKVTEMYHYKIECLGDTLDGNSIYGKYEEVMKYAIDHAIRSLREDEYFISPIHQYKRKSIIVEAIQFHEENRKELEELIPSIENMMIQNGQYIIREYDGAVYLCSEEHFDREYEFLK